MPPAALIESLHDVRRRVKVFGVIYGIGVVVAAAVALLLAVVFLDWLLGLPANLRVLVNLAAVGTLGYSLYRWVVKPALAKLSLTDLAGRLENVFPQFDDTLRSTVNFMDDREVPGSDAMKQKTIDRAAQVAKSVDLSLAVQTKPVWQSAGIACAAVALLALLIAVVDPGFRRIVANRLLGGAEPWPKSTQLAIVSDIPNVVPVGRSIDVKAKLNKGNARQAVMYYRYDSGRWEKEVMTRGEDGTFTASIAARLENNKDAGKLQVRVEAGDDEQALAPITVVPRLDIKTVTAMVTPPEYANLPASPIQISERPVVTVLGSSIQLRVTFNKQLDKAKGVTLSPVDKNRKAPEVKWEYPAAGQAFGTFVTGEAFKPNDPFRFTLKATDTDGFDNPASQEYQVIVHDDVLPSIQIEEPRRNEERTPNAFVPLKAVAEDDYGVNDVQLVVRGVSPSLASKQWVIDVLSKGTEVSKGGTWNIADSTTERKRFHLGYQWELSDLKDVQLKSGDQLEYFLRAKDNFRFNGQDHPWVESGKLRINIVSHEELQNSVDNVLGQERQTIEQIRKTQEGNKAETADQAKEAGEKPKFDDAQKATVGRLANQQMTATAQAKQSSDRLKDLLKKMEENKLPDTGAKEAASKVADQLDKTAEGSMKQAAADLNKARETKTPPNANAQQQKNDAQKASENLQQSAQQQEQASKQLEDAANKLSEFGGVKPSIDKLEEIKKKQEEIAREFKEAGKETLGKKAEELTPEQKAKLDKLAEKQDNLAKETAKALDKMESKSQKMEKSDPTGSKAMKQAAQLGKQQGIPQKQSTPQQSNPQDPKKPQDGQPQKPQDGQKQDQPPGAAQDMQQNQQANAQQKHKEIELGLEMMLNQLKEAEKRKLEELQKNLAEMQKLIGELIVRQAGHNIDNLILQDPKKITEMTQEAQKDLFDSAQREIAKLNEMKPDITVLSPSQEQTERNCRDYARKAEALPDPAPATKLTAAAGKMEQSIVHLRKAKLPEAYPLQAEALAALKEAKTAVDAAKNKADDDAQKQKEETIKQAYVKLLEAQKKLDEETKTIDGTQRDKDGNLPFLVTRRLGALPGEQGKLSDEAKKIGEQLDGLGSIVYKWANKDIVQTMGEVKTDLAKPDTGTLVQADQKRVEEQLQAMIDNLAKPPPDMSKFAQRGGGQGGGGGGKPPPSMPTDVELRLLKELQQAVNGNTKVADAEVKKNNGKKDKEKLFALGGRQGELRNLLDQLMQKATKGKVKLGKEPDPADQLPEEKVADKGKIEEQELTKGLLDDKADGDKVEKGIGIVGDRMARSRQRLALNNDPGAVTQEIQKQIIIDLDDMIAMAQKQQAQSRSGKPKPGEGEGQPKPQPGQGEGQAQGQKPGQQPNPGGQQAAQDSSLQQGQDPNADLSKADLKARGEEWGGISPRTRDAVLEGRNEKLAHEKYGKFVEDYYREVAKKAAEQR